MEGQPAEAGWLIEYDDRLATEIVVEHGGPGWKVNSLIVHIDDGTRTPRPRTHCIGFWR